MVRIVRKVLKDKIPIEEETPPQFPVIKMPLKAEKAPSEKKPEAEARKQGEKKQAAHHLKGHKLYREMTDADTAKRNAESDMNKGIVACVVTAVTVFVAGLAYAGDNAVLAAQASWAVLTTVGFAGLVVVLLGTRSISAQERSTAAMKKYHGAEQEAWEEQFMMRHHASD